MLWWAVTCFTLAIVAALIGFSGITSLLGDLMRILFFVFLFGAVASLVLSLVRGRTGEQQPA